MKRIITFLLAMQVAFSPIINAGLLKDYAEGKVTKEEAVKQVSGEKSSYAKKALLLLAGAALFVSAYQGGKYIINNNSVQTKGTELCPVTLQDYRPACYNYVRTANTQNFDFSSFDNSGKIEAIRLHDIKNRAERRRLAQEKARKEKARKAKERAKERARKEKAKNLAKLEKLRNKVQKQQGNQSSTQQENKPVEETGGIWNTVKTFFGVKLVSGE